MPSDVHSMSKLMTGGEYVYLAIDRVALKMCRLGEASRRKFRSFIISG